MDSEVPTSNIRNYHPVTQFVDMSEPLTHIFSAMYIVAFLSIWLGFTPGYFWALMWSLFVPSFSLLRLRPKGSSSVL